MEALLGNGADVQLKGGKTQEAALHIAARIDEAKEGFFYTLRFLGTSCVIAKNA